MIMPPNVARVAGTNYAADPAAPWLRYYPDLDQGSHSWLEARCGLLTASEMKLILTPTLKVASNDKTRSHLWELLSQRISRHVEPRYISDDMLRGMDDEIYARAAYAEAYEPISTMGFMTNDRHGFTLGYSPDGLVGYRGLWECKSRAQKYQVMTIAEMMVPDEYMIQLQAGLLVSERDWIDFTSYSNGLPMVTIRMFPDAVFADAILEAAGDFERRVAEKHAQYTDALASGARLIQTTRRTTEEITL